MKKVIGIISILSALFLLPLVCGAQQYEPTVGQAGKDVIWVPTPDDLVEAMLDMAGVTPSDYLMDLGSGDGKIVIAAAKRGITAVGIEYNPDMVELSKKNAEKQHVSNRASFQNADLFTVDLSRATVITMYLLPSLNKKLRPSILNLKPGTRIVSHAFDMEDWKPDQTVEKEFRRAYLWIVPAKVEGTWTWSSATGNEELKLTQKFQEISGALNTSGRESAVQNAKLEGNRIRFTAGSQEYSGIVNGNTIAGSVKTSSREEKWSAELK